jgi:hypothetical protein
MTAHKRPNIARLPGFRFPNGATGTRPTQEIFANSPRKRAFRHKEWHMKKVYQPSGFV